MQNGMETLNKLVGSIYGRLTVVGIVPAGPKALRLRCACACGGETVAAPRQLRIGEKKSCGCLKRSVLGEATRTHGRANSRITGYSDRAYGIWQAMKDRCTNPKRKDWHCYGGKGVTVCERWLSFENFIEDMGEPPEGYTLDRNDGSLGYSKSNCVWATRRQQSRNTSNAVWVVFGGTRMILVDWLTRQGIRPGAYYSRIRRGWTREEALGLVSRAV
jgi:hypothetical protein